MFEVRSPVMQILAGAAVVAVAGCGASVPGTDGANVSKKGDSIKVESDKGSFETSAKLPDDFPRDEVPILDGAIISATALNTETDKGFTVAMRVPAESVADAAGKAAALLEGAGFKDTGNMTTGELIIKSYENDTWVVSVTATVSDQEPVVSYTLSGKPAEAP